MRPDETPDENRTGATLASRHALTFIFITMLVDTIGLGIIIPVTPQLIEQLTGDGMSGAARWGGWLFFVYALMQFLCAPLIGNLSDRFGRRPVLIISLVALGIDYLITGLAPTIAVLFIGRFLSGMAGAAYPTVNAYIADVAGKTRGEFRIDGRRLRAWFHHRAGHRRIAGRIRPAHSFLRVCGNRILQRTLWTDRVAGIAPARTAAAL